MSTTIFYHAYPKECDNPKIIRFLDEFYYDIDGRDLSSSFYDACRKYGEYDDLNSCYIFRNNKKLQEFLSLGCIPEEISDYISLSDYTDDETCTIPKSDDDIFIIWIR